MKVRKITDRVKGVKIDSFESVFVTAKMEDKQLVMVEVENKMDAIIVRISKGGLRISEHHIRKGA